MSGFYSINSPNRLFERLVERFTAFNKSPSEDGIFDVVFPLYHLREWIHPSGHQSYKDKTPESFTREESLHSALHYMPEYRVIRDICNNAKHFDDNDLSIRTKVYKGARAGLMTCGDSLGVTHFLVDGVEIRKIFWLVYRMYFEYFNPVSPATDTEHLASGDPEAQLVKR